MPNVYLPQVFGTGPTSQGGASVERVVFDLMASHPEQGRVGMACALSARGLAFMLDFGYNEGANHIKSSGSASTPRYPFSTCDRGARTMSYSIPNPTEQSNIPYGYCHCGCGQLTHVPNSNHRKSGWVKGVPMRYIRGHHSPKLPLEQVFWARVPKLSPEECWIWQGAVTSGGYGNIRNEYKSLSAHRVAYELHYGTIPPELVVRHKCDVKLCCNPFHLEIGSHKDNSEDMVRRGRSAKGASSGTAKIASSDILEILRLYNSGLTQKQLALRFGISRSNIGLIVNRQTWTDTEAVAGYTKRERATKLKKSDIEEIFNLAEQGLLQREIAVKFGVSRSRIGQILTGQRRAVE